MSSPSSDFDVDIDEDDLRQIDRAEQEALSNLQLSSSSHATTLYPIFSTPSITSSQAPPTIRNAPPKNATKSPSRTLPWLAAPSSQANRNPGQQVKGRSRANEPPTHHYIDTVAAKTWIYPTNVSFRDYQFNIVQRALFDNVLVSLPTGLGKTFIAATVMFNYYRWFPRSKIVFVAPTKPLVSQQVEACFNTCGVPYSETAQLTGTIPPAQRATAYEKRRVFYMTPQTLLNDLRSDLCDPRSIVCLVIDEAHRGTGNYAYGECVALIRQTNPSLRILALSATPGKDVDAVQNVITALCIARVEIRIETSIDLREYLHKRKTDVITLPLGPQITELRDLLAKIISKYLDKVKSLNDYRLRDPFTVAHFSVHQARQAFMASPNARNANFAFKNMILGNLGIISSLGQARDLLTLHGIQPSYEKLRDLQKEYEEKGGKPSKMKSNLVSDHDFQELMTQLRTLVDNPNTVGHPKLERAASMIIDHFMQMKEDKQDTRVIVFSQYRSSAAELVKQLRRQEPIIKPTIFVGQADSKNTAGMKQKEQIEVIDQFKKGKYNAMVATCIGEEGLDIGDVDLVLCYDSSSSPVRMLQRMGRAGRKREGRIVFLVTEGKEADSHVKSFDAYEKIQEKIAAGNEFEFDLDKSPRILPKEFQPDCVKQKIIPPDEGLDALELKVDRRKKVPKRTKNWKMPENVETGFVKASMLGKRKHPNVQDEDDEDGSESSESEILTREEEEYVRNQRVQVSTKPPSVFDMKSRGLIPAGAVRKRLIQTKKSMNDPTRPGPRYTEDDIDDLLSTPPNLIASSPLSPKRLSQRNTNIPRKSDASMSKIEAITRLFENQTQDTASDDDLPDLSTEFLFNGKRKSKVDGKEKGKKVTPKNSDDEYGLPSEFDLTPRKRIRITISSDEE